MHTRIYTFFFSGTLLVAMLAAVSFAFAQTQDTGTSTENSAALLEETATTSSGTSSEQTLAPTANSTDLVALSSEKQLRIINLAANISNKSDAYRSRLSTIADRAESRMQKLEADGYEVSNVRNFISEARSSLENADATLNNIDLRVTQFVTSAEYVTAWDEIRNIFITEKSELEAAKAHLVNAVDEMYRVQVQDIRAVGTQDTATTTASSTEATSETL